MPENSPVAVDPNDASEITETRRPKIYHPVVGLLGATAGFLLGSVVGAVTWAALWLAFRILLPDARPKTLALRVGIWVVPVFFVAFVAMNFSSVSNSLQHPKPNPMDEALLHELSLDYARLGCQDGASLGTLSLTHQEAIDTLDDVGWDFRRDAGTIEFGHQISQETTLDGSSPFVERLAVVAQTRTDEGIFVALATAELFPSESLGTPGSRRVERSPVADLFEDQGEQSPAPESVVTMHLLNGCQRPASVAAWADMVRDGSESRWNLGPSDFPRKPSGWLD